MAYGTFLIEVEMPSKSAEDKTEEFTMFKYANICGLILGIMGAAFIEFLRIIIKEKDFRLAANSPDGSAMIIIIIAGFVLYSAILNKTKELIGVAEYINTVFTFETKKNAFDVGEYFLAEYIKSESHIDNSLKYKFQDIDDNKKYDGKKKSYQFIVSHPKNDEQDIIIHITENNMRIVRPARTEAKEYFDKLRSFLENKLQSKTGTITKLRIVAEYNTEENT